MVYPVLTIEPDLQRFLYLSYLLNVHPCRQRVADLLRNKGRRAATPCRQR